MHRISDMQNFLIRIFLLLFLLMMSSEGIAADGAGEEQSPASKNTKPSVSWDLADLIPKVSELSVRLFELHQELAVGKDLPAIEHGLSEVETKLEETAAQIERLKASKENLYIPLVQLNRVLELLHQQLEKAAKPATTSVKQLSTLHKKWAHEGQRWQAAAAGLSVEEQQDGIGLAFTKGQATISKALGLIRQSLQPLLVLQGKAAHIRVRIADMTAESNRLIQAAVGGDLTDTYPPIISDAYRSQLKSTWHPQAMKNFLWVRSSDHLFFAQQRGLIIFQVGLALFLIIGIYRNRKTIEQTQLLQFMATRPISAGLFLSFGPFHTFHTLSPAWWQTLLTATVGICLLRLANPLLKSTWKRWFLCYLVIILISINILFTIGSSIPALRLFFVLASAVGVYFFLRWARAASSEGDGIVFIAGLRVGACCLAVVLVAELFGNAALANHLFVMPVRAIGLTIAWWLVIRSMKGGLEWIFHRSDWPLPAAMRQNPDTAVRRLAIMFNGLLVVIYVCTLLVIWEIYPDPIAAFNGLLAIGVTVGEQRITVGLVLEAAALAFGAYISARVIQRLFLTKIYDLRQVDPGVRFSINHLITYAFVFAGFLLALAVLGFRLNQLTIMISALGVGAGFGLKEIVNNLIGGLILLFERPVRVGDAIQMGGQWAEVKEIGLRATRIRTHDYADVIVPNSDLTTNPVTNWTLSSRMMRIRIPVGVAYGSDIPLVIKTLKACAKDHNGVAARPESKVLFLSFGDSTLDFELRVWISDFDDRRTIQTELHQQIDQSFREAGIEIAFPQRDLHLRSVDETVLKPLRDPKS